MQKLNLLNTQLQRNNTNKFGLKQWSTIFVRKCRYGEQNKTTLL